MKKQGEIRVRIIDNLSDHEGYEEGTILKIKEINLQIKHPHNLRES